MKERADADANLRQKEEALEQESHDHEHLILFDPLTGLPNRVGLQTDLERLLAFETSAEPTKLTFITVDLDSFNHINDTLGHAIGDRVLQEVARRLTATVNENAVYRLSEDEFVQVLKGCADPLVAGAPIERVLAIIAGRLDMDGEQLFITASAGLAVAPAHGSTLEELLSNAEVALYDAKLTCH